MVPGTGAAKNLGFFAGITNLFRYPQFADVSRVLGDDEAEDWEKLNLIRLLLRVVLCCYCCVASAVLQL